MQKCIYTHRRNNKMDNIDVSHTAMRALLELLLPTDKLSVAFEILRQDAVNQKEQHKLDMASAQQIIADAIEKEFPLMNED